MNKYSNFNISFQNPVIEQVYDPPSDPLDEFYDFEMNFKRFFYEYNHFILLEIGDEKITL